MSKEVVLAERSRVLDKDLFNLQELGERFATIGKRCENVKRHIRRECGINAIEDEHEATFSIISDRGRSFAEVRQVVFVADHVKVTQ